MRIILRQSGGIGGTDDRFDIDENHLTVTSHGGRPVKRRLTKSQRAKVTAAARNLLAKGHPTPQTPTSAASDSMLTEIDIGVARRRQRFEVASGEDAPDELWDLVDAVSDAARP